MSITAKLRYLKISPRKVRLVADLIRKKNIEQAQALLSFTTKKAAKPVLKLLKSAAANAKNNFQLDELNLYISKIFVDEGPKMKRWKSRARGRVDQILKRSSHITIVLDEVKPTKGKKKKAAKPIKYTKKQVVPKTKEIEKAEKSARQDLSGPEEKQESKVPSSFAPAFAKATAGKNAAVDKNKKKPKGPRGIRRIFRRKAF